MAEFDELDPLAKEDNEFKMFTEYTEEYKKQERGSNHLMHCIDTGVNCKNDQFFSLNKSQRKRTLRTRQILLPIYF